MPRRASSRASVAAASAHIGRAPKLDPLNTHTRRRRIMSPSYSVAPGTRKRCPSESEGEAERLFPQRRRSRASLPAAKAKPSVSSRSEGEAERLFPQRRRSRASLRSAKAKPSVSSLSEGEAERLFAQH